MLCTPFRETFWICGNRGTTVLPGRLKAEGRVRGLRFAQLVTEALGTDRRRY